MNQDSCFPLPGAQEMKEGLDRNKALQGDITNEISPTGNACGWQEPHIGNRNVPV